MHDFKNVLASPSIEFLREYKIMPTIGIEEFFSVSSNCARHDAIKQLPKLNLQLVRACINLPPFSRKLSELFRCSEMKHSDLCFSLRTIRVV